MVRLHRGSTLWRRGSKGRESQAPKGCLLWVLKRDWRDHGGPGAKTTKQCRGRTSLEITAERRGNGRQSFINKNMTNLSGKDFSFSPLRTMLAVGVSYMAFIMLR